MDNSKIEKSSVRIKSKKKSVARYDYHDIIGLIYTIILTAGLGIGMTVTSAWLYYKNYVAGDKASIIGLFDYFVDRMQFRFNTAYLFAVLLLWAAVGFILATALLKVVKNFQKTVYPPKEFFKLFRNIFIVCFSVAAISVVVAFAMSFIFPTEMTFINAIPRDVNFFIALLLVLASIVVAALAVAIFSAPDIAWVYAISQNPKNKVLLIISAVIAALFNPPAFICFLICAIAVKKSSNKEETSKCWAYPSLVSTIFAIPVVAFVFLKLSEYAYTNTKQLLLYVLPIVIIILVYLLVPTFIFCYYYFKMYLPATDANYYTVASSTVLGDTEIKLYDSDEEMEVAKAKKGKSVLAFSIVGLIPGIITLFSIVPSILKVISSAAVVVIRAVYGLYGVIYDTVGWVIASMLSKSRGVTLRAKPLPELAIGDKLYFEAIDWIPSFEDIREAAFSKMSVTGTVDWIPTAILAACLFIAVVGLIIVFITKSKLTLFGHEFGKLNSTAKAGKVINNISMIIGIISALILTVMTYITAMGLIDMLYKYSL